MLLSTSTTNNKDNFLKRYTLVFVVLVAFSVFFGYSFDESVFAGYAADFYYYGINPFYYWNMGMYYLGVDIAGYFPTILINVIGLHNVITEEFGVKLPIDIAAFLGGLILYRLLRLLNFSKNVAQKFAFIYLIGPMVFFYAFFQGNPLVFTLLLLLLFVYTLIIGRYKLAGFFLALASASYLYPLFLFPFFVYYLFRKAHRRDFYLSNVIYLLFTSIGIGTQYIVYFMLHIPTGAGTAISPVGGVASLSSSLFSPPLWNIYYFFNLIHICLPYYYFQIFFLLAMVVPSFYIIARRWHSEFSIYDFITIMALQGLGFAMFSPISDPQYIVAALPFILIICAFRGRFNVLYFISAAAIIGFVMIAYVVPYNFSQFFVDVNTSAGALQLFISPHLLSALSLIYASFLTITLILILKKPTHRNTKNNFKWFLKRLKIILNGSTAGAIVFAIASFIIIFPGISHLPSQFAYQANDSQTPINLHIVSSPQISGVNHSEYSFTVPEQLDLIPMGVKENSNLGIYIHLNKLPVEYGTFGYNDIFAFNNSHSIGETFDLRGSSQIILNIEFVNKSYRDANVYVVKGNGLKVNDVVYSSAAINGTISLYTKFGDSQVAYNDVLIPNHIFSAGEYSVIVSGITNKSYYLGGWNGAPSGFNVSNPFIIGKGTTVAYGGSVNYTRFGLTIMAYYSGKIPFIINGNPMYINESGFGGVTFKIPANFIRYNNTLILLGNVTAFFSSPTAFYYEPFPENIKLLSINYWDIFIGAALFDTTVIVFIMLMRRIMIWVRN